MQGFPVRICHLFGLREKAFFRRKARLQLLEKHVQGFIQKKRI